jgi:hypothetical protein
VYTVCLYPVSGRFAIKFEVIVSLQRFGKEIRSPRWIVLSQSNPSILHTLLHTTNSTYIYSSSQQLWSTFCFTMFPNACVFVLLILIAERSYSFTLLRHRSLTTNNRIGSALFAGPDENSANAEKDSVAASEMKQVNKGLTHIKYNKYAPTAEEAANMTDEQFRKVIFTRMVSLLQHQLSDTHVITS